MLRNLAIQYFSKVKEALRTKFFLIIFFLPYILDLCGELLFTNPLPNEPSLKWEFSLMFICLLTIEIIYQKGITLFNKYCSLNLNIILIPSLLIFLYTFKIANLFDLLNKNTFHLKEIHARYYLPFVCLFFAYITYKVSNKSTLGIITINYLFIIISLVLVATSIKNEFKTNSLYSIKISPKNIGKNIFSSRQPTILIILDEYESPIELFKATNDSSVFELSNYLQRNGWEINNRQYSQNITTVNSISSLFNFNYNKSDQDLTFRFSLTKLYNSNLINDLKRHKNISFNNYGIFDIANKNALNKVFYYEAFDFKRAFLIKLFSNTILPIVLNQANLTVNQSLKQNTLIIEDVPQKISSSSHNQLYYIHLLMPHSPYNYIGKLPYKTNTKSSNLLQYTNYYKFTNKIFISEILKILKDKKFRIIITGDHGYRGDPNLVNPKYTATYYLGFPKRQLDQIKSVQDLGSLIYVSY